jgi:hypothetical protein
MRADCPKTTALFRARPCPVNRVTMRPVDFHKWPWNTHNCIKIYQERSIAFRRIGLRCTDKPHCLLGKTLFLWHRIKAYPYSIAR